MRILAITDKQDERFLRNKTKPVHLAALEKKELRKLVREMRETMQRAPGIGLAANQVGLALSLFVAQVPALRDEGSSEKFYAFFNPKIVRMSGKKVLLQEGCLSVPGLHGLVERDPEVTLEGYTVNGKKVKVKARGLLAHVFQHEVDHLRGVLFTDTAKETYSINTADGQGQ